MLWKRAENFENSAFARLTRDCAFKSLFNRGGFMRYKITLSYDGSGFCGWQSQKSGGSIQDAVEFALEKLTGIKTRVTASGRTDAGVHALGQICQLDGETNIPAEKLRECFNRILPPDVRILKSARAYEGFDCTRAKKKKTYVYRAYFAESELPLSERFAVRLPQKPDLASMQAACALVTGEHDFAAFRATGSSAKTTVRTLYSASCRAREEEGATHYEIEVCGNGFLYNMVRIIAGTLIQAGGGKIEPEAVKEILQAKDRSAAGPTAPAHGLTMLGIE